MKLKAKIGSLIESITHRKCEECKYNNLIFCERLDKKGIKCREKIYPYGFELKEHNKTITESLSPKCSNEMPKEIICNCTKEQK